MKAGWQIKTLLEACVIRPPKSEARQRLAKDSLVSFVPMEDLGIGVKQLRTSRTRKFSEVEGSYTYFADGDVLLAKITPCFENGKLGVASELKNGIGFGSSEYIVFRPENYLSKEWLYYYLSRESFRAEGAARMTGAVGHKRVSTEFIDNYLIPIPPLPEQHRIVAILDEAFEAIATAKANAEKNLQNARAVFESYLESVFAERGPGWVEKRLDQICTFSSGGTPSKNNSNYWNGNIPWISGRDMKSTRLSDSYLSISKSAVDESSTRMAAAGTLLILVRGMGLAHGAQIAELTVPCAFNQDIRGIHADSSLIPRYLLFALRDGINSSATVLSNAAHGTLKIDSSELHSVIIPIPSLDRQLKIVKTIDQLSAQTQTLTQIYQRKLIAVDELKKSLLHQAFSGAL